MAIEYEIEVNFSNPILFAAALYYSLHNMTQNHCVFRFFFVAHQFLEEREVFRGQLAHRKQSFFEQRGSAIVIFHKLMDEG